MWVSGETIDETIAFGARNLSFVMALVRTSDRDDCGLRIFELQNQGPQMAQVPSPSAPAWMVLAIDMRARSLDGHLGPHVYDGMALQSEASAPSARAVLAGSRGRSVATTAREVYTCKPQLFRG